MSNGLDDPLKEANQISAFTSDGNIDVGKGVLDRLSSLEFQVENLSKKQKNSEELNEEIKNYFKCITEDSKSLKKIRKNIILISFFYLIFLNLLFICLFFYKKEFYLQMSVYSQATFIVLVISSSVILLGKILGGAFKAYGERYKDEYIPPQIKQLIDNVKDTQN